MTDFSGFDFTEFDFTGFDEYTVPVTGGDLAVLRWPAAAPGAETVLLVHGITANALAWAGVVEAVDGWVNLIAPDLRGRAHSRTITGPWGIDADADDLIAILDHSKRFLLGDAPSAADLAAYHPIFFLRRNLGWKAGSPQPFVQNDGGQKKPLAQLNDSPQHGRRTLRPRSASARRTASARGSRRPT